MAGEKYKNLKLRCERTSCMLIKWTVWLILATFFQVVFQRNFVGLGTARRNLSGSICWQSVVPPASLPPFFLFPEQATELHAAKIPKKLTWLGNIKCNFKAIAQSGVVLWHLQTTEKISFTMKLLPWTLILTYIRSIALCGNLVQCEAGCPGWKGHLPSCCLSWWVSGLWWHVGYKVFIDWSSYWFT